MAVVREPLRMHWKLAWKVLPTWGALHRVAEVTRRDAWDEAALGPIDEYDALVHIEGVTCCGRSGALSMPGIISRMGLPRCLACCRAAGVAPGPGIPGNGDDCGPMDAWQVEP